MKASKQKNLSQLDKMVDDSIIGDRSEEIDTVNETGGTDEK